MWFDYGMIAQWYLCPTIRNKPFCFLDTMEYMPVNVNPMGGGIRVNTIGASMEEGVKRN